jgi:hypothetical protein
MNSRGGLTSGGEERQQIIRHWLRDKDLQREAREQTLHDLTQKTFSYTKGTYYVAWAALVAAVLGIIVALLHL